MIALVNRSSVDDYWIAAIADAVRAQLKEDVGPAHGVTPPDVAAFGKTAPATLVPPPDAWIIQVLDQPDGTGDLGSHSEIGTLPFAQVFWNLIADDGGQVYKGAYSLSAAISHEAIEMLTDPTVASWIMRHSTGVKYAREICDPVNASVYPKSGIDVADFVLPAWYLQDWKVSAPFAFKDPTVHEPFQLGQGGYCTTEGGDGKRALIAGADVRWPALTRKVTSLSRVKRRLEA